MRKWLMALFFCLMTAIPALAEDVPELQQCFVFTALPAGKIYTVYTGPGTWYHVASDGKAKVSSNGEIWCYGTAGDSWLMVEYETNSGSRRIGYIRQELEWGMVSLDFGTQSLWLDAETSITDDPHAKSKPLGTVRGAVDLLAIHGKWAYVEGVLTGTANQKVRGFVRRSDLPELTESLDLPVSPDAGDRFRLMNQYALNLPEDALAEGMAVYPLADGTLLIAYRCEGSDKLWMRVISEKGKKLWAKSVPEKYYDQITLTESGFICETFDNSECDSGMRYTYTCKGRKWSSKKVSWIAEPDRAYADNTANFTLLRHTFGEGGQPMPLEITNRLNGETLLSETYTFKPFLYEMDGSLLLLSEEESGSLALRIYSGDLTVEACLSAPEAIGEPHHVQAADHAPDAVYFFTGYGTDWQLWRLDRKTLTFDAEPVAIPVPKACTLTPICANAAGMHDLLMKTARGSYLCQLQPDGTLLLHQVLAGEAAWVSTASTDYNPNEALVNPREGFLVLLQNSEGEFILQRYEITEG